MIGIIPAAGLGTRMAVLTGGGPKELLPLGRKTVLERVIEEAITAGTDEIVIVSTPNKPAIEEAVAEWSSGRFRGAGLRVVYQTQPKGLADAIVASRVTEQDSLILLGDCLIVPSSPSQRMSNLVYRGIDGCIAVETVPDSEVCRYGICEIDAMGTIARIIEKPQPSETESRWAVAARYVFSAALMSRLPIWLELESQVASVKEISLAALLQRGFAEGFELKAVALQPDQSRVDCGTPEEYAEARRLPWD